METHAKPTVLLALLITLLSFGTHGSTTSARVLIEDSQIQEAESALSDCLASARATSALVAKLRAAGGLKPREAAAVKDCMETLAMSIDELQRAIKAVGSMRGSSKDVRMKVDNVQTWVSAALTNDDTCMDGFAGRAMNGEVKSTIRSHIVKVAHQTSKALALINGIA